MTLLLKNDLYRPFQYLCVPSIQLPSDHRSSCCCLRQPFWMCLSWSVCTYPCLWAIRQQYERQGANASKSVDTPLVLLQTKHLSPFPTSHTPLAAVFPAQVAPSKWQVYSFWLGLPRLHPQCPLQQCLGLDCLLHQRQQLGTFVAADKTTSLKK